MPVHTLPTVFNRARMDFRLGRRGVSRRSRNYVIAVMHFNCLKSSPPPHYRAQEHVCSSRMAIPYPEMLPNE